VTGAAGFTGRHTVAQLASLGAQVIAVIRPGGTPAEFAQSNVTTVVADLRDDAASTALFEKPSGQTSAAIDTVFHVAAVFRTVGVSLESLRESHVGATQTLLEAAHSAGVRRFLHVSTIGVQGPNPPPNATEDDAVAPADDYQTTKLEGERVALSFGKQSGLPVTVVRPCAIYGAGDDRFLKIIRPISGSRFTMIGQGTGRFHLVHVEDLVRGMLQAAEAEAAVGEVLTLGGGAVPTLAEFVRMIATHTGGGTLGVTVPYSAVYAAGYLCEKLCGLLGIEPPLHRRRVKFFGSDRSFDLSRARALIGYEPQVSLSDGVAGLVEWHRQQGDIPAAS